MIKSIVALAMVGLIAMLITFGCDSGEKKVSLKMKFVPDMKVSYKQITKGTLKRYRDDSLTLDRYNENTMNIDWHVRRVLEDSTAEILEQKSIRVFSKDETDSVVTDTVREMTGYVLWMKPNGKVIDLDFTSDRSSVDLAYVRDYFEQGAAVFPKGEHSPGYSWTQTTRVILPDGPIEASTTYTISSLVRERGYDCAVIEYEGNLILPIQPYQYPGMEGVRAFEQISGLDKIETSGNLYFAYKEGMVVLQREKWKLDGDRCQVYKETKEQPTDTVNLKIKIEYDVDYSLLKLDYGK